MMSKFSTLRMRRGNVLVQVALIVLILAGMVLISIPGFNRERHAVRRELCVRALATIAVAKVAYASDNDLKKGTPVTLEQLAEHGGMFDAKSIPQLPAGAGELKIGPIGTQPSCVYDGETILAMPHLTSTLPAAES